MKKNLIVLILFAFVHTWAFAQLKTFKNEYGIKAGLQQPYYHSGDANFKGLSRTSSMLTAGIFDQLRASKALAIRAELMYSSQGAKNQFENNRVFKPKYISVALLAVIGSGPLTFDIGVYNSKLIAASNWDFFGPSFDWKVKKWKYIEAMDCGGLAAITYNFIGMKGTIGYSYGLHNVRPKPGSEGYFNDPKMSGNKNAALTATILINLRELR